MGYYVRIQNSDAVIPAKNVAPAFKLLKALNHKPGVEKRGGSWDHKEGQTAKWFSWMDADYDVKCKSLQEILDQLGFETDTNEAGDIAIKFYDNKTGQEDLFFQEIGKLVTGSIEWHGEDGATYLWEFGPKGMKVKQGRVVYK